MTSPGGNDHQRAEGRGWRRIAEPAFARLPPAARRSVLHALGRYAPWEDGFDATAPGSGPGETTGPPDFVGIGAQKAGTTWWFDALRAHPDIYSRVDMHKERHFFDRYAVRPFGPAEISLYHNWFPRPDGALTGEWTPDYMHYRWVPGLLAQAAPGARLLVLLRDPVERFRSGLAHHRRDRGSLTAEAYLDALTRGFYDDALRPWATRFPHEQMLILQYEQCRADPIPQLARTYRFLGLDPFVNDTIGKRVNVTEHATDLEDDVRRRLVEMYEPDVRALTQRYPEIDLSLWPNFAGISVE